MQDADPDYTTMVRLQVPCNLIELEENHEENGYAYGRAR